MPYSSGPYSDFTSLPVPDRPEIHSARLMDFATKRYLFDAVTGGYQRMPPTVQRVVLLVAFAAEESRFITPEEQERARQGIRTALAELTKGPAPAIDLKSVDIGSDHAGQAFRRVTFRDLTRNTGIDDTVQLT